MKKKCFSCENKFSVLDGDVGILYVWLDGKFTEYMYCSKSCAEKTLSNLNSKRTELEPILVIERTEVISESFPFKMRVNLKKIEPKVEFVLGVK